mmetsp:Transcript_2451/g.3258  ORF Transcript_2451/g.3258 Transcript_2451/m.3258 type:complete len:896 (+) Transcript_2451:713-3400(+)
MTQVQKTDQHFFLILEYCAGGDLQRLIRTRKSGRLTERLARRLMRDLTAGLKFLAGQQLIHRDIKPQNLLLTGPVPLDEINDPCETETEEESRRRSSFPSNQFHLKIADFGFARHLKKASLADTLCGSPLYMAPEILQHRSYDNKADLWSAGTVLFEMIAGRPPFHGENHIDLLRNIQQKAVRLPPDLRVSKECVKLLRILLNRNPIGRAGFREFIEASNAFVALGCNGVDVALSIEDNNGLNTTGHQTQAFANLGPISEVDDETSALGSSPARNNNSTLPRTQEQGSVVNSRTDPIPKAAIVSPSLCPIATPKVLPAAPILVPLSQQSSQFQAQYIPTERSLANNSKINSHFSPLQPSPPGSTVRTADGVVPSFMSLGRNEMDHKQSRQLQNPGAIGISESSQNSDDSEFVMVEKGSASNSSSASVRADERSFSRSPLSMWKQSSSRRTVHSSSLAAPSSPNSPRSNSSRFFSSKTILASRNLIPPSIPFVNKGILSTSPGTGGALVGMMGGSSSPNENALVSDRSSSSNTSLTLPQNGVFNYELFARMLAAAEDVGRRAINVAHVGDTRAYLAMKLIMINESLSSSTLQGSVSPMEGVEEESEGGNYSGFNSESNIYDSEEHTRRGRSISTDQIDEDDDDEMPFAMPLADDDCFSMKSQKDKDKNTTTVISSANSSKNMTKATSTTIQVHFREALSCYIKALTMLKGSVNASQRILTELNSVRNLSPNEMDSFFQFKKRCEASHGWLAGQFKGVLERAEAGNTEVAKLTNTIEQTEENKNVNSVTNLEELIYNHSLACGRDGAVKQLLGQYEAARACYRSAGLLAETLLMEPKLIDDDKKVLEGYVQCFSERINELDYIMLQQSRQSMLASGSVRRGSSVLPVIGGFDAPSSG